MATTRRVPLWAWDALSAAAVLLAAVAHTPGTEIQRTTAGWIVTLIPVALVLLRRWLPWTVLGSTVLCFGVLIFTDPFPPFASLSVAIAVYTVAVRTDRRTTLVLGLSVVAVLLLLMWISTRSLLHPASFQIAVTIGFAASFGDAVRSRRAYIVEITQRAVRAEQTREAEASRRVAEDRLRIARDLHDAVAHQISVISLNAAVASKSVERDPQRAQESLATIRTASRRVLGEIGDLLATLRTADDTAPPLPTAGLALLPALLLDFEASGLQTSAQVDGDLGDLPAAVDVVAYRVIQEALTNARKHGADARARLTLEREESEVHIQITNRVRDERSTIGTGLGLTGIRERVESVRGSVRAGLDGDRFHVDVRLPARRAA